MGKKIIRSISWVMALCCLAFFTENKQQNAPGDPAGQCTPNWSFASGYTFIRPDLVDSRSAYAPYLLNWSNFYRDSFDIIDWQKKENVEEWSSRFCDLPNPEDVESVVYQATDADLTYLADLSRRKKGSTDLGYPFTDNSFAACVVYNGCEDVVEYLKYARSCETYCIARASKWRQKADHRTAMRRLIPVGEKLLNGTKSHFLKLRYLYQMVRLAHYAGDYQNVLDLYERCQPKIDRRKPSVLEHWILAHLAGARQKLGDYSTAAYQFAQVFQQCASKREQAFESFKIRNQADWEAALYLCQSDQEQGTLYLLRAAKYQSTFQEDFEKAYEIDPLNPQLTLLLLHRVQYFEKWLMRTPATDRRFQLETLEKKQREAALQLIRFQEFVAKVVASKQVDDWPVWAAIEGYLQVIARDLYAAEKSFQRLEKQLPSGKKGSILQRQLEIWRTVAEINELETERGFDHDRAAKIRTYRAFTDHPDLPLYLQDIQAEYFTNHKMSGLAALTVHGPGGLFLNPSPVVLDQLIRLAEAGNEDFLETAQLYDTTTGLQSNLAAQLIEAKGIALLNQGHPEAALLAHRSMRATDRSNLKKYSGFKESIREGAPPLSAIDTLQLNRVEFVEKLIELEQNAKGNTALYPKEAARYYYLLGLGYYNSSWFGYEWELRDYYRDSRNWKRLGEGPVFPFPGSYSGNYEVTDVRKALECFEKALELVGDDPEFAAKIVFMAARTTQKIWFTDPDCNYLPGSSFIPLPPEKYRTYYRELFQKYQQTAFFSEVIAECKWLKAYSTGM